MNEDGECTQLDRFYLLLPAIIRRRDEQEGRPLRALGVIAREAGYLEADIGRLYNDWFIETCQDWVVPYLADLVAYPLPGAEDNAGERGRLRAPRREVAKALSYRRRGGTLALLEELAWDITGWPARAVEYDQLVASTVNVSGPRATAPAGFVNVRDAKALRQLRGPFETIPHLVDIRRPGTTRSSGGYRPETVALFVWRTAVRRVTRGSPRLRNNDGGESGSRFTFDPLGREIPLYLRPDFHPGKLSGSGIDPDIGFPVPVARHHFLEPLPAGDRAEGISIDVYGEERSLAIYAEWRHGTAGRLELVPARHVKYVDLKDWPTHFEGDEIGVDPIRGKMVFPDNADLRRVQVTFHYAGPADIGAGRSGHVELAAFAIAPQSRPVQAARVDYRVGQSADVDLSLALAITQWREADTPSAVIEITDSGTYELAVDQESDIILADNRKLEILRGEWVPAGDSLLYKIAEGGRPVGHHRQWGRRAATPRRPAHRRASGCFWRTSAAAEGPSGNAGEVTFRACTLLPGGKPDALPRDDPHWRSLRIDRGVRRVAVENCITGRIEIGTGLSQDDARDDVDHLYDPTQLVIADSIVDARPVKGTPQTDRAPWDFAIGGAAVPTPTALPPAAELDIRRSTILGTVDVPLLKLAENTIFAGEVAVRHRQDGGMRFCYVPPKSKTPRRYQCQPDLVDPGTTFSSTPGRDKANEAAQAREDASREGLRASVRPRFISTWCGSPGYAMLANHCPRAITEGADDDGEMGALHDAFDFRRLASLAARITEFIPARVECRVVLLSPGNEHELRS